MVLVIGICGGSGSGKSTFASHLAEVLGPINCSILPLDCYYKDFTLPRSGPEEVNYDHPDSIDLELFAEHLMNLRDGREVFCPVYDYVIHKRLNRKRIVPNQYILAEGLFLFNMDILEELTDIRIYIDTPEELRLERRIRRDTCERGRTKISVIDQFNLQVRPMHHRYVVPNRDLAQIIIRGDQPYHDHSIEPVLKLIAEISRNNY